MDTVKTATSVSIKNHLRAVAENNYEITAYFYELSQRGYLTEDEAKKIAETILLIQKIGSTGYIFCTDSKGILTVHPEKELIGSDISDYDHIKAANIELSKLASTDSLTGLNNRGIFQEQLHMHANLSGRNGSSLSLIFADIDNFKEYNDTYGHTEGDNVLRLVGALLKETARISEEQIVDFISEADKALYLSKETGRDRVTHILNE